MSKGVKLAVVPSPGQGSISPEVHQDHPHMGGRLLWERNRQKLSIEQVAAHLKRSVHQISEIEAGNYAVFSDYSTLRGFIRSYAKILKIDEGPLLEELSLELPKHVPNKGIDRQSLDTPFPSGHTPWFGRHSNQTQRIIGGVLLVFLAALLLFVYRAEIGFAFSRLFFGSNEVVAQSANPVQVGVEQNQLEDTVASSPSSATLGQVGEPSLSEPVTPVAQSTLSITKEEVVRTTNREQKGLEVASEKKTDDTLELEFKKDSWVQIKHLDGSKVASQVFKAGTKEVINVDKPLNVTIGYAPGVDVKLREKPLELPLHNGSNVVNLSIK